MKKKRGKKGKGDVKRHVNNLRAAPYSLKDGDVVAAVDRMEDPDGRGDLTRADDEVRRPPAALLVGRRGVESKAYDSDPRED